MVENKRKKFHDKDKYYRLAKEQGLRSRAAFKLSQINRKFSVFETLQSSSSSSNNNTAVILDLCAAPGGWTQIVARSLPKVPIIAVDILPIRAFSGQHRNVTTLIGDITTDQCQANITRTIKSIVQEHGMKNDNNKKQSGRNNSSATCRLVLHDGAPNVGADYAKDAYVQNEIALSALKCATQHLCVGGTFITKVYRSRDYAAYHWTVSQLFTTVTAFKPTASRNASAEIFLIAQNYKAPQKLDAKFLDPKYVFASIEDGDPSNQNNSNDPNASTMTSNTPTVGNSKTIFDKNWDKHVRQRGGYDMDHYDATMRHIEPVSQYISSHTSMKDAIQILSTCTGLSFHCHICRPSSAENKESRKKYDNKNCYCQFILHHPLTTMEMKEHCSDLRVLNKSDFKAMFNWRTKMQHAITTQKELLNEDSDDDDDDEKEDYDSDAVPTNAKGKKSETGDDEDDEDEEMIAKEIEEVRLRRQRERKRLKKKEHEKMQKRRKQAALSGNMINMDISNGIQDSIFSLATITNAKALDAIREVNLDQITDEDLMINYDATADDDMVVMGPMNDKDEDNSDNDDDSVVKREKQMQRERDLEEGYIQYLQTTKNKGNVVGTKLAKRSKKLMREKVINEIQEDTEMAQLDMSYDAKAYAKLLHGKDDSDDDDDNDADDSDSDDGYDAAPMTPSEFGQQQQSNYKKDIAAKENKSDTQNPLLHQFDIKETQSMKTARWFSNPLFASIGQSVTSSATTTRTGSNANVVVESDNDDDDEEEMMERRSNRANNNLKKRKADSRGIDEQGMDKKITPEDIIASMPKTDKQIRHEKRLKLMERDERKKVKRARKSGDIDNNEVELVAGTARDNDDSDDEDNTSNKASKQSLDHLSVAQKAKVLEARKLIKAGLGHFTSSEKSNNKDDDKIELVPQDSTIDRSLLPIMDDRKYDSENEDYDSDDHAKTLALGTMMLRRSKEKAFVDASYNRYSWNDPSDLPEWFVDDENKHYRPQLPIPPALLAKMKEKMMALSAKPIAKVAEARARKSRRAKVKLAAAKKQAEAVANSNDMSEAMKLKAISKALTSGKNDSSKKGSGKSYVVAKKGRGNIGSGVKGAKVVDKRMKKEKRASDRIDKTKKRGKQNGLTGSKKRRNHK